VGKGRTLKISIKMGLCSREMGGGSSKGLKREKSVGFLSVLMEKNACGADSAKRNGKNWLATGSNLTASTDINEKLRDADKMI